jgi:hypothetical protein
LLYEQSNKDFLAFVEERRQFFQRKMAKINQTLGLLELGRENEQETNVDKK